MVALEKVEKNSGTLIGSSIASIQKSTAPEVSFATFPIRNILKFTHLTNYILVLPICQMLLALMDEAYTGSTIEDRGGDSGSDDNNTIDISDPVFLELLKDENDGIAVRLSLYIKE